MTYPRPRFVREESWRYKRVKESWRSPRGKTSRVRRSKKGWPPVVKIGYARPRATRGIHPSGFREVLVWRPQDLENLDSKTQVARIAHTVGENKRIQILEQAKKMNIRILNPGLKKPAEVVPEVAPETAAEPVPEPAPTPEAKEEEIKPVQEKTKKKTRTKATKKGKSKK
jgi:large subunit ribosomal protein L32e